eukprot:1808400-Pleurochrysis_carterae.AAC.1
MARAEEACRVEPARQQPVEHALIIRPLVPQPERPQGPFAREIRRRSRGREPEDASVEHRATPAPDHVATAFYRAPPRLRPLNRRYSRFVKLHVQAVGGGRDGRPRLLESGKYECGVAPPHYVRVRDEHLPPGRNHL